MNAPNHNKWLYTLYIAIDANFRLKQLDVSSEERDPGLNHGYAYLVEEKRYKAYLSLYDTKVPPETASTCSNYDAVKSANSRGGKGLASSGAGTVDCSRHDMKRPVSVGDLQKGERYVNMDYMFLSSLNQNVPHRITVSYDIACQWIRNLHSRCDIYPPNRLNELEMDYLIPKFHLPAHQPSCHVGFSFNYTQNVGRTDGEAPERGWAAMNPIASSTKEMGPGSRRDTLDDHFGDLNWRKITIIAATLLRRAEEALVQRAEQVDAFIEFDSSLPEASTSQWTVLVRDWEADWSKPNPFASKQKRITEPQVCLELALNDASSINSSSLKSQKVHNDMPPSMLIMQGLELEEQQRRLCADSKDIGPHSTDLHLAKIVERANRLKRQIDAWCAVQLLYIPAVGPLRVADKSDNLTSAVDTELLLPSQVVDRIVVSHEMMDIEWQLRFAQCHDALHDIRRLLLTRTQMLTGKRKWLQGQQQTTRRQNLLRSVQTHINNNVAKYRKFRNALDKLSKPLGKVGWADELKPLEDDDIRGLSVVENGKSEGYVNMSWIWKTCNGNGEFNPTGPTMQEALRIEWCKSRARAHRWQEECLLLQEEMRRVIQYFLWEEREWLKRAQEEWCGGAGDVVLVEGRRAYALRQAAIQTQMRQHCEVTWRDIRGKLVVGPGLPEGQNGQDCRTECHEV